MQKIKDQFHSHQYFQRHENIIKILVFSNTLQHLDKQNILTKLNHGFCRGFSCESPVLSGIPQGTDPVLFLCFINDLPDSVVSQVRLFVENCVQYRQIKNYSDHARRFIKFRNVGIKSGNGIKRQKCHILSDKNKTSFYYQLCGEIQKTVNSTTYLGLNISNYLKCS